ncbi:MAG TPA: sugar ABC transporter substrate-binding protein, partial [Propionibacteriaceae bacterium]
WSNGARRLSTSIAAAGLATTLVLTGCSGPGGGGGAGGATDSGSQSDIDAALDKETQLTFWAWGPQYQAVVDAFNKAHPKVKVTLQNQGSGTDQYTKLQNVIKAGSGIPDISQIEFSVSPQFALGGSLLDLNSFGLQSMKDKFSESSWGASQFNGALYGLPQDAGPMAMFYRKDVFDTYGLTVPKTWDEYIAAARKLKKADSSKFIAADAGDAGATNGLIWQAGGRPYKTEGDQVTVSFDDEGTKKYAKTYSPLIEERLVDTKTAGFTPEWNSGLANGKYATLVTGAWAAGTLQRRIPDATGKWRVAPMPKFAAGDEVTGQTGGSLSAVMKASPNKAAAIGFVQWMASSPEASKIWTELGGFPCTTATLTSQEWLNIEVPYFGNQKINQVFAQSAEQVGQGWQFLPFQAYANSVYADTVGQAYVGETSLLSGLQAWEKSITNYGNSQGFKVS